MDFITIVIDIVNQILTNFDLGYMFTINTLVYITIKTIDEFNGDKKVNTLTKRIMLLIAIILMFIVYKLDGYTNNIILVNSSILAPVFWSWILKPIFNKLGIGYKQIDNTLN